MKVDSAAASYFYTGQRLQPLSSERLSAAASSAPKAPENASGTKQLDFTRMTRQELTDWANTQFANKEMTLDEAAPFMMMTMRVSVGVSGLEEIPMAGDKEKYDFSRIISEGIKTARENGRDSTLKALESAAQSIQKYQGRTIGVDVFA